MYLAIDFQGFYDDDKNFVVKEFSAGSLSETSDFQIKRFLFKPPCNKSDLQRRTVMTNDFCTRFLHHLNWEDGEYDYTLLRQIAELATHGFEKIITKVNIDVEKNV